MKLRDSPGACWLSMDRRRSLLIVSASFLIGGDAMAQTQSEASSARKVSYLVVYRPGPAWPPGKPVSELPLREHWQYMVSLFGKGTMKMAGPLTDNSGGAVVLEVADEAEAKAIVDNDPAVKAGFFVHQLHPWGLVPWEKYVKK
jgi:uncharacterized protein